MSRTEGFSTRARARKRTRRACDKCNQSRTRCNGLEPCGRCQEYGYDCHYNRQSKKRGRVPLKDKQQTPSFTLSPTTCGIGVQDNAGNNKSSKYTSPIADDNHQHQEEARRDTLGASQTSRSVLSPEEGELNNRHDHQSSGRPQHAETSHHIPHVIESCHLGQSPKESFHGSPSAHHSFGTANLALNFSLASPGELDGPTPNSQTGSIPECRHRCLEPLLPYVGQDFPISVACDLFDVYLLDPGTSLFRFSSPFILTRIFRRSSLLGSNPRPMSPALLATILWCCAKTADISVLLVPGSRSKLANALYELAMFLVSSRDPDRWRRTHGGLQVECDRDLAYMFPETTSSNEPAGTIDDVLTFILLCIGVSAGDFKSDSLKWWSKAKRLALALRLDRLDAHTDHEGSLPLLAEMEAREEKRRVFWLLYSLDRHLALSYNRVLEIPDSICDVYVPLPESVWENLDTIKIPTRAPGPPVTITGAGFFEYFLPLMVILGDIIEIHHSQHHPRLGNLDKKYAEGAVAELIAGCEASLESLTRKARLDSGSLQAPMRISNIVTGLHDQIPDCGQAAQNLQTSEKLDIKLVIAYSTFILHVLHVLFYGKWDAISMLDNEDEWITTPRFAECASHAIAASEAVSDILKLDPELTFMPYLFGIYLLHGSFILLLFADRMPQLGPNQSVEQACETIIRAHEVCVVTLSTEFQRNFRRVLRSTLYNVRGDGPAGREEHRLARRQVLSLYRWTRGAKGLGI